MDKRTDDLGIPFVDGLPLWEELPSYCCPSCGKPIGFVGNWLAGLVGAKTHHRCTFSNVMHPQAYWAMRQKLLAQEEPTP